MQTSKLEERAAELMELLLEGPRDRNDILAATGWHHHQFTAALRFLRQHVCPIIGAVVPRPVADDGYSYHLLDTQHPNSAAFQSGHASARDDTTTRLRSIHRDVVTFAGIVDGRTVEGRKAKLIEQHVRHLVENLDLMDEFEKNGASA